MNSEFNNFDLRDEREEKFDIAPVKKDFSKIGFGFLIFSGITLLVSLIIQLVVVSVSEEIYYSHLFLNLLTPVSMYVFALPVLIAFWRGVKPCPPEKRKMRLGEWLLYLIVGLGLMYIGAMIGNNVMSSLSVLTGNDYQNGLNAVVDGNMWVTAFFVVLIAPIGEEFVFRKLLIDRTGKYGCFISALMSGLVFGLMHANLYQFFYATLLGFVLGYLYYNGRRVEQDYSEAVKCYKEAAEQGDADAQYQLGECYYHGEGVERDDSEAVKWYEEAAEQRNADAQYELGDCYYNGKGVKRVYSEAVKWFRKAAEQGNTDAQYKLGECYYYGEGVEEDEIEAEKWMKKSGYKKTGIKFWNKLRHKLRRR